MTVVGLSLVRLRAVSARQRALILSVAAPLYAEIHIYLYISVYVSSTADGESPRPSLTDVIVLSGGFYRAFGNRPVFFSLS